MQNYTGKKVFLGMDVHKKTYAITAICDGQIIKRDTLRADPSMLYHSGEINAYLAKKNLSGFSHRNLVHVIA